MNLSKLNGMARAMCAAVGGLVMLLGATPTAAGESTVAVTLWDKRPDSAKMNNTMMLGMGKMMMGSDMAMAMMGITLDTETVAAGMVTFDVVNSSKDIINEVIYKPIAALDVDLPYLADQNRIDEETDGHLGEVSDLDPGQSGALTVDLAPELYLLYCIIPGHYIGRIWTVLTVTE
jgi:uncharacterized cupredoxin-like copper-binding protein